MSTKFWQAFYFRADDHSQPPERIEVIEAECDDDAAKIAAAHLGRCKRVDIESPRWEPGEIRTIVAVEPVR
jgi:hypothetical protein